MDLKPAFMIPKLDASKVFKAEDKYIEFKEKLDKKVEKRNVEVLKVFCSLVDASKELKKIKERHLGTVFDPNYILKNNQPHITSSILCISIETILSLGRSMNFGDVGGRCRTFSGENFWMRTKKNEMVITSPNESRNSFQNHNEGELGIFLV